MIKWKELGSPLPPTHRVLQYQRGTNICLMRAALSWGFFVTAAEPEAHEYRQDYCVPLSGSGGDVGSLECGKKQSCWDVG